MKADLVMWAKNGASPLRQVLKRAREVLPSEVIENRIFVDDHSTDDSVDIAKAYGWTIYENKHGGIASGINIALSHVRSEFFISLEQDLVLANDWFKKIPEHMKDPQVIAAAGIRFPSDPILAKLHEVWLEKYHYKQTGIDNTLWRTRPFKEIVGCIPEYLRYGAADSYIGIRMGKTNYKGIVDSNVVSLHLRLGGLKEEVNRHYLMGSMAPRKKAEYILNTTNLEAFRLAIFSPLRGIQVAIKKNCPQIAYYYPLLRFAFLKGAVERKPSI